MQRFKNLHVNILEIKASRRINAETNRTTERGGCQKEAGKGATTGRKTWKSRAKGDNSALLQRK